jgi:hypothetical protein
MAAAGDPDIATDAADEWTEPAKQRLADLSEEFRLSLKSVALTFTSHENAEVTMTRHVDQAYGALVRLGSSRHRWIRRPEAEVGLGGALIGFAFSAPDAVGVFATGEPLKSGLSAACFFSGIIIGGFFFVHGTMRSQLPLAPLKNANVLRRLWRYLWGE